MERQEHRTERGEGMNEYIVTLQFSHGLWEADLTVSAPDDAMTVRAAIDQCNATHRGEGVAIVRHQYLPGAIKYNILT